MHKIINYLSGERVYWCDYNKLSSYTNTQKAIFQNEFN